ncbi:hypothetical protein [Variovorax terrae]|uniref:Uncharacterized protein n=1 Tax=Variovorax terrae TaxID=2923278 RepID=A0A9X2AMG1_9BURK|nr:hypothetical protein [Variovorax terrae]MCJ0763668.1 hypothetical protein [Variovorax terrae]
MALHFKTEKPKDLLAAFDARIGQTELKGKITTWKRVVSNGQVYYTHSSDDWKEKAFFQPAIETGQLTFYIKRPADQNISTPVYGYYHGHLSETYLNHFDNAFSHSTSTALPLPGDNVSA